MVELERDDYTHLVDDLTDDLVDGLTDKLVCEVSSNELMSQPLTYATLSTCNSQMCVQSYYQEVISDMKPNSVFLNAYSIGLCNKKSDKTLRTNYLFFVNYLFEVTDIRILVTYQNREPRIDNINVCHYPSTPPYCELLICEQDDMTSVTFSFCIGKSVDKSHTIQRKELIKPALLHCEDSSAFLCVAEIDNEC
jgi:hypothetical protein